jgi:hypothetical protein
LQRIQEERRKLSLELQAGHGAKATGTLWYHMDRGLNMVEHG